MTDNTSGTIQIPLTKGFIAIVDECDADLVNHKWHVLTSSNGSKYAARRTSTKEGRKYIHLHRVIFERKYGHPSSSKEIADHVDGNPFNNVRSNIRIATPAENCRNRKRNPDRLFKGVTYCKRGKNRWVAVITVNRERIYLGSFATAEDAHEAYKKAAIELHGEFARWD